MADVSDVVYATSVEMARNFDAQVLQLAETLGIVGGTEIVPAGTDLKQFTITGELSDDTYTEGNTIPLSEFEMTESSVGTITIKPYRKTTTFQAIQKAGFYNAVLATDDEMLRLIRLDVLRSFFAAFTSGTGAASGTDLKAALLACENELTSAMEQHGDSPTTAVYFVSRDDYQAWATANDVHSDGSGGVFGMEYIKNLGGIAGIVVRSSFVPTGKVYATASDNLHIYTPDYTEAAIGGLEFVTGDAGTIGVIHSGKPESITVETVAVSGLRVVPEVTNYIVIGTVGSAEYGFTSYGDAELEQELGTGKVKYISDNGTWTVVEVIENSEPGFVGNRYKVEGIDYTSGATYQLYSVGGEATGIYVKLD